SAKRNNVHFSSSLAKAASATSVRQYRIKCTASLEKNIYSSSERMDLGTTKQSSGLHFAGNFAGGSIHGKYCSMDPWFSADNRFDMIQNSGLLCGVATCDQH